MSTAYKTKPSCDVANVSRRDFLKTVSAAGALSISPITMSASFTDEPVGLPINMAGYDYDRVHSLIDGRVEIKGCNLDFEISSIGEMKSAWYKTSLPWVSQEMEETRTLMGKNYWPYGIEPNREALAALFRYSYEQGFSPRQLTIEELFHPSGLHLTESLG
jgi:hypothetical protein